jgi:hypothetical protein
MRPIPGRLIRFDQVSTTTRFLSLLGFCIVAPATYSAEPSSDSDWYMIATGACEPKDPRAMLELGKVLGVAMSTRDIKEHGKVVATTISAADGSSAIFYRGKTRCEAALAREMKELDRYK